MIKSNLKKLREFFLTPTILKLQKDSLKTQTEILKGMIFNSTIADSRWLKYKSFSPGGWAADFSLLYTIYRTLDGTNPQNIIEFGLGQTSKLVHQYANYYNVKAETIEHDPEWVKFFLNGVDGEYKINIKLLPLATLEYKGYETLTYQNIKDAVGDNKYDLIIVDGPFGSKKYSRTQMLQFVDNNLSDNFCIIIDDYERNGERDTVEELKSKLNFAGIEYVVGVYSASKQHIVICSKNWKFLTTL